MVPAGRLWCCSVGCCVGLLAVVFVGQCGFGQSAVVLASRLWCWPVSCGVGWSVVVMTSRLWCWLVGCGAGLLAVGQLWCWPFGCGGVLWGRGGAWSAVVLVSRLWCWLVGCGDGQLAVVFAGQLWRWLAQVD